MHRLDFYTEADIEQIVRRSARILGVRSSRTRAGEIARRSRGTPRIANRLLRRVRDYAQVRADGRITAEVAQDALKLLEVDEHGFDEIDRRLLRTIIDKFGGGPVGVNTLAAAIERGADAIEDIYEPFLMQIGLPRADAARARRDRPRLRVFRAARPGKGSDCGESRASRSPRWPRYVPPRVLTNADLEKLVETTDEWILQRTGIRERHIVDSGVGDVRSGEGGGAVRRSSRPA